MTGKKTVIQLAMEAQTQEEADSLFETMVGETMKGGALDRETAEKVLRQNLGYFAGYYSNETRERVERLYRCAHPIFGSIAENGAPTPEEAFKKGLEWGEKTKKGGT